ncbi:MAG: adenine deaminase C-terminal domain-containing protein [Dehalococcoidia bacterium]|nr:adenine deaminase C-terminal domain-containing protein [Dehalococcoidia bacterium]
MKNRLTSLTSGQMSELINVAIGKEKADLAIVGGTLLDVYSGELLEGWGVAVKGKRIAYVGKDVNTTIGTETRVINAAGKILIPGLIDSHNHLFWYFRTDEGIKWALKGGTTTIVTEMLEVVFSLGYQGAVKFLDSIENQPMKVLATVPPMVSTSQRNVSEAIGVAELRKLLKHDLVVGLGESYWSSVVKGDKRVLDLLAETSYQGKKIMGHSAGATGNKLVAYLVNDVRSCHEPITVPEVLERLRLGAYVILREGGIRRDLEQLSGLKDLKIDTRRLTFCSDGLMPKDLVETGHMNYVVQKAINLGFDPVVAIQMATLNAAEHLSMDNIIGGIAPGRYADILIIPDIKTIRAEYVISYGQIAAKDGELLVQPRKQVFPGWASKRVLLSPDFTPAMFAIRTDKSKTTATVRVIDQITEIVTRAGQATVPVSKGAIGIDVDKDLLKVAVIDFRVQPLKMFVGLIRGFKMKKGAFASSQAWDLTAVIVAGASEKDMAKAVNRVIAMQGGIVLSIDGEIAAEVPLTIGAFVSELPMEELAARLDDIQTKLEKLGMPFGNAHLSLTTLTSPAIPFIRICEDGLVDVKEDKLVDLVIN